MNEQNENIEIKPVQEETPAAPYAAKSGGSASVTLRLLTQEEFDRLEKEKAEKAAAENEKLNEPGFVKSPPAAS